MRAIDADRLQKQFDEKSTNPNYRVNMHNIKSIISNAPTVEAIPKADYEARLKADMVAMLTGLQFEIEEKKFLESSCSFMDKTEEKNYAVYTDDISNIIQQKNVKRKLINQFILLIMLEILLNH